MSNDLHRPRFHLTAPTNWINDPNGVCFHDGRYHVYYQYNPNAAKWGDIHWGHWSSADLVHWRDEPIALAPTPGGPDAGGCFSGSFALVNGQPTLYYTGFTKAGQVQCAATSDDLQHWTLQPERTITTPPEGIAPHDFRDPYVIRHDGRWYMTVGASRDHELGQALLYRSDDGIAWDYRGPLFTAPDRGFARMWECPNFFPLGDKWVLTTSGWLLLGAHWFVGRFENEQFVPESDGVLDVDSGTFAHLAMHTPDGRTLQWAWMNEQREQALIDADGWAGAMTVPRELSVDAQGRLNLRPAAEIETLREAPVAIATGGAASGAAGGAAGGVIGSFAGRHLDIEATFTLRSVTDHQQVGLTLLATPDGSEATRIVFWPDARQLTIERARSSSDARVRRQDVKGQLILEPGEPLRLRVLLDASVLEVYANDRLALSTRVYPSSAASVLGTAFVDGDADVALQAWTMGSIYQGPRSKLALPPAAAT